jgi:hypothetical protein
MKPNDERHERKNVGREHFLWPTSSASFAPVTSASKGETTKNMADTQTRDRAHSPRKSAATDRSQKTHFATLKRENR